MPLPKFRCRTLMRKSNAYSFMQTREWYGVCTVLYRLDYSTFWNIERIYRCDGYLWGHGHNAPIYRVFSSMKVSR